MLRSCLYVASQPHPPIHLHIHLASMPPRPPPRVLTLARPVSPVIKRAFATSPARRLPDNRRFGHGRQREPYPPILSDFNRKVLNIPKSDPNGGWKVEPAPGARPGGGGRGGSQSGSSYTGRQKVVGVAAVGAGVYYCFHLERVPGKTRYMSLMARCKALCAR